MSGQYLSNYITGDYVCWVKVQSRISESESETGKTDYCAASLTEKAMSYAIQKLAVCQKVAKVVSVTSSEGFSSFCTYVGVTCSPKHGHVLDNSPTLNVNVFMDGMENMNC